ncbi:hypothetical protein [Methanobrevibacter woesei]|uniref:hypothetical protein n=1 Tax=Methanobrevibacter woesei TaxID=190976 RepID=UPI0023F52558|nr:hypothetical protein [Methanobrevibacter woesei]
MKLRNISFICLVFLILMSLGSVSASGDVDSDKTIHINATDNNFNVGSIESSNVSRGNIDNAYFYLNEETFSVENNTDLTHEYYNNDSTFIDEGTDLVFNSINADSGSILNYNTSSNNKINHDAIVIGSDDLTVDAFVSDDNYETNNNHATNNLINSTPFSYSFLIPNYVNVTGVWRVTPGYCGEEYYVTGGVGGIVKLPTTRSLLIPINGSWIEYGIGYGNSYENNLNYGSSTFIPLDNKSLTGILIKVGENYTNITYNGFLNTDVSQVSGLFKHDYNGMAMHDYENIQVITNGEVMMDIFISNPVSYDEEGLRFQLAKGQFILAPGEYTLTSPYNRFANYNSLKFVNTGESLVFSEDMMRVYNFPSRENVITSFNVNNTCIIKTETIGYGLNNSIIENGFESVQSFMISNTYITDEIVNYYLNQKSNFPMGGMKAVYGTFLTALSTNWMYDNLMENLTDLYNVSATRDNFNIVMSGVEFGGSSYVHCLDPSMGFTINGNNSTNGIVCRLISSLLLSEVENSALNMAGINGTSSVTDLFTRIMNLENFTVDVEGNYLSIILNNSNEYKVIIDLSTGLVYDLFQKGGFVYKGAISTNNSYCYHDYLTDNIQNNLQYHISEGHDYNTNYETNVLSEEDWDCIKQLSADALLMVSASGVDAAITMGLCFGLCPYLAVPLGIAVLSFIAASSLRASADDKTFFEVAPSCIGDLILNYIS